MTAHCEGHGGPGRWYCCQHPESGWPCIEAAMREVGEENVTTMPLSDLLRDYRDGDEHGWDVEFAWLREHRTGRLLALLDNIEADGITTPILLGTDGRVWDGHHRLCVAWKLGLERVPVTFAG